MKTADTLTEIHRRAHRSLETIISHCESFSDDDINRTFQEFGYPSLRMQIHHIIGAELYWIEVLKGNIVVEDDFPDYPTIDSLEKYRERVFNRTQDYLKSMSTQELNASKRLKIWGGTEHDLFPVNVVMRPISHVFHHLGQISVMCRLLGKPAPATDYPVI